MAILEFIFALLDLIWKPRSLELDQFISIMVIDSYRL